MVDFPPPLRPSTALIGVTRHGLADGFTAPQGQASCPCRFAERPNGDQEVALSFFDDLSEASRNA